MVAVAWARHIRSSMGGFQKNHGSILVERPHLRTAPACFFESPGGGGRGPCIEQAHASAAWSRYRTCRLIQHSPTTLDSIEGTTNKDHKIPIKGSWRV